jgi:hypothetical protein
MITLITAALLATAQPAIAFGIPRPYRYQPYTQPPAPRVTPAPRWRPPAPGNTCNCFCRPY